MASGASSRGIRSPIGTVGAAAPYGMATGAAADRRVQGGQFVPLSVFFLQLDGEEEGETDEKQVTGDAEKSKEKPKETLGKVHFDGGERNQVKALKGPRAKVRKKSMGEMTVTANVAAYPVPIGKPLRRTPMGPRRRAQWMERLAPLMRT